MSILITGIDMPKKGNPRTVLIYPAGTAEWEAQNIEGTAVPVPPHGRLIDADALAKVMAEGIAPSTKDGGFQHPFDIFRAISAAPTIIPAEEGET